MFDLWCRNFKSAAPVCKRAAAPSSSALLARILGGRVAMAGVIAVSQRAGLRHCDDVEAGIDELDIARDSARQIGEQIDRRTADLIERHAAPQRRMPLLEGEHLP